MHILSNGNCCPEMLESTINFLYINVYSHIFLMSGRNCKTYCKFKLPNTISHARITFPHVNPLIHPTISTKISVEIKSIVDIIGVRVMENWQVSEIG